MRKQTKHTPTELLDMLRAFKAACAGRHPIEWSHIAGERLLAAQKWYHFPPPGTPAAAEVQALIHELEEAVLMGRYQLAGAVVAEA